MRIALNGESRTLEDGSTVAELLRTLELDGKPVAVERNGEAVRKSDHGTTQLKEGDRVEVVTFVGGG